MKPDLAAACSAGPRGLCGDLRLFIEPHHKPAGPRINRVALRYKKLQEPVAHARGSQGTRAPKLIVTYGVCIGYGNIMSVDFWSRVPYVFDRAAGPVVRSVTFPCRDRDEAVPGIPLQFTL